MKACEAIQEELPGFAAERLPTAERVPIEVHLRTCTACRAEVTSLARLERLLDLSLPSIEASTTIRSRFANRMVAEIEAEEAEAASRSGLFGWLTRPWLIPAVASAAVAIAALVISFGESSHPGTDVAGEPAPAPPAVVARATKAAPPSVARSEPAPAPAPVEVADVGEPKEPGIGVPPEVESDPELFVDFVIIRELETLEGQQESAG